MHFLALNPLFLSIRLNSKWDLRRLCKTVGAVALPRLVSVHIWYRSHI